MEPIVFDDCFGWLHPAAGSTGLLLCNPYGHEALWSHQGFRRLAEYASAHGIPTLRFDYPGTGDSTGEEHESDRLETWIRGIGAAIETLRLRGHVQQIVIAGLRLGATLASLAAEQFGGVDGLIFMEATVSGRDYMRELGIIQRRWRNASEVSDEAKAAPTGDAEIFTETFGFRLFAPTVAQIREIDLSKRERLPVQHVLFLDHAPAAPLKRLIARYEGAGADVTVQPFEEYLGLIGENDDRLPPRLAYAAIVKWIQSHIVPPAARLTHAYDMHGAERTEPAVSAAEQDDAALSETAAGAGGMTAPWLAAATPVLPTGPVAIASPRYEESLAEIAPVSALPHASATVAGLAGEGPVLHGDGYIEMPVRFAGGRAFGIYCRPAAGLAASDAVLFPSTGANHHIGNGRIWVLQARRLARQGIASLRMDIGVLGEGGDVHDCLNIAAVHSDAACKDVSDGIDWLVAAGHAHPVSVGICSGAFLSFHAARLNERLNGVVMVNQQIFQWSAKRHAPDGQPSGPTQAYLAALTRWNEWKRLIRGETRVLTIIMVIARRFVEQLREGLGRFAASLKLSRGKPGSLRDMVLALEARGTRLTMLFGPEETGLAEAALYFGRDFAWIRQHTRVELTMDPSVDHALFLYPARDMMMDLVDRHIAANRMARQVPTNGSSDIAGGGDPRLPPSSDNSARVSTSAQLAAKARL